MAMYDPNQALPPDQNAIGMLMKMLGIGGMGGPGNANFGGGTPMPAPGFGPLIGMPNQMPGGLGPKLDQTRIPGAVAEVGRDPVYDPNGPMIDRIAGAPPIGGDAQPDVGPEVSFPQPGLSAGTPIPAVPYAGTGGAPGGSYNPQPTQTAVVPPPAPLVGSPGGDTLGGTNPASGLAQALGALQVPPPPDAPRVATPPPPGRPQPPIGNLLKLLMASGGTSAGQIPPMAAIFGR